MMTDSPHSALWRKKRFRLCAPELSLLVGVLAMALYSDVLPAQTPVAATGAAVSAPAPATGAPITLEEAIRRAQISDLTYRTAAANKSVAGLDKSIARSALLPGMVYHNQYIYTKPGQLATPSTNALVTSSTTPIFIANNSVHEYISLGVVTETVGIAG